MKKYIRLIVLAALLVTIVCTFTACGGVSVDLMEFVDVSFSGVDGNGKAVCKVDSVALEKAMVGDTDGQISVEEGKKLLEIAPFEFSISYKLDKDSGLSNGDKVTVSVSYNEDTAKKLKIKATGSSKTFKVEDLKEPINIDPFDPSVFNTENGVSIVIDGISPLASLSIQNNCPGSIDQSIVSYTADKQWDICNGDVITITAEISSQAEEQGYVLTQTETTVPISGLNSYITDLSMLKAEDVAALQQKAQEYFETKLGGGIDFSTQVNDFSSSRLYLNNTQVSSLRVADKGFALYGSNWGSSSSVIIPFYLDISDVEFNRWEGEYYDEPILKSFPNSGCYITFNELVLDANGNLIKDGSLYLDMSALFPDTNVMFEEIRQNNGGAAEGSIAK